MKSCLKASFKAAGDASISHREFFRIPFILLVLAMIIPIWLMAKAGTTGGILVNQMFSDLSEIGKHPRVYFGLCISKWTGGRLYRKHFRPLFPYHFMQLLITYSTHQIQTSHPDKMVAQRATQTHPS
jgi:hypothetical protein